MVKKGMSGVCGAGRKMDKNVRQKTITEYLDVDLSIHATQVVHNAVQIELTGSVDHVLT